jgi:4,5-dihydroxyphthalate decarboxylase
MHTVVIRKDVYERYPQVAKSLYEACCASKNLALMRMRHLGALRYMLPWMAAAIDELDAVFGSDPWPYGITANRTTLQTFMNFMAQQSAVAAPLDIDEAFVDVGNELR